MCFFWSIRFQSSVTLLAQVNQIPGREANPCLKYDIYLAHSADDLDWITDQLLPLLEEEHGLKVFVESRDGEPGVKAENIARYVVHLAG